MVKKQRQIPSSLCAAALFLCLAAAMSNAQTLDPTTGRQSITSPSITLPTSTHGTCNVLWDISPGVFFDYAPSGAFSQLVTELAANGTFVTTTSAGLDPIALSGYNVLVVCVGSAWLRAYTPAEVAAIRDFQANGGGLLVLGDNADTPSANINPVTVPLGTTRGLNLLLPLDLYVDDFILHPIFTGVRQLYMRAAGELGIMPPSGAAARDPSGAPVVSVVASPRTVITADINLLDNSFIGIGDNRAFGLNLFHWLCGATPTPVRSRTWGELKTIYR